MRPRVPLAPFLSWILPLLGMAVVVDAAPPSASPEIVVDVCTVLFAEEIDVPALDSGQLVDVYFAENEPLAQGQLLAELDSGTLAIRRRAAELKRTQLAERIADETEVQYAETVYEEASIEHDMNLKQAQRSPGSVTQDTLRRSRLGLERANLERQRVAKQRRDLEIDLQIQRAELDILEDQMRRMRITSPIDGIVLSMHKNRGEWIQMGESIARVGRMDRLKITARLDESQMSARHALGSPAVVRWSEPAGEGGGAVEHTLRGSIVSVDPQLFDGGHYRVHVMIDNCRIGEGWLLVPGRQVVLKIYPLASEPAEVPPATARRFQEAQPASGGGTLR